MKNFILEKTDQVRSYTNMRDVFEAASIAPQDYDWYVSDIETNWRPPGFQPDDQWFTGDELAALLSAHEIQFIWAVFSAVPKGLRSSTVPAPYVEDNPRYWAVQSRNRSWKALCSKSHVGIAVERF
jgi:hypothetical protein